MNYSSDTDKGLKVFVVLRVIVITFFLGTGAFFYFKIGLRNEAILLVFIIFIVYFLSFLYLLLYPLFQKFINWFKGIQISFDIIIASAVIYVTGGMLSPFIFFYALIIIFANITLTRNAGYVAAASSATLYLIIGVITLDLKKRLISINRTALEILGIASEDKVLGKEANNLIPTLSIEKLLSKRSEERLHSTTDGRNLTLEFSSS